MPEITVNDKGTLIVQEDSLIPLPVIVMLEEVKSIAPSIKSMEFELLRQTISVVVISKFKLPENVYPPEEQLLNVILSLPV